MITETVDRSDALVAATVAIAVVGALGFWGWRVLAPLARVYRRERASSGTGGRSDPGRSPADPT
jgi:hypothetical protein